MAGRGGVHHVIEKNKYVCMYVLTHFALNFVYSRFRVHTLLRESEWGAMHLCGCTIPRTPTGNTPHMFLSLYI